MVEIKFPGVTLPGFRLVRGQLLDVTILGVGLVIPPVDITFWAPSTILQPFTLFKTEDITNVLVAPINAIPEAVWTMAKKALDDVARDYYERHPKEKT